MMIQERLRQSLWLVALVTLLPGCQTAPANPTKETSRWWSHIARLGSDEMAGRLTGSEGYHQATLYVADQFQRAGLEAAGGDGYFQRVSYQTQTLTPERSSLTLTAASGASQPLILGWDLVLSANIEQQDVTAAPLVFVGYGLSLPESGIDDFADVDLTGKIAVILSGAPANLPGPLQAYARAERLAAALAEKGAVGLITLQTPAVMDVPWERVRQNSRQIGLYLSEPDLRRYPRPLFAGAFNPAAAEKLFATAPQTFAALCVASDAHQPLPHFSLGLTVTARVMADHALISADNVIAELPGSDPLLADDAVILSAHLDHLGTAIEPPGIFRGAMDNASGIASLLEVARQLKEAGIRPKRSILFAAVGGEEKGLLGSRFLAAHPTRHVGRWVADINMDMFLPLYPLQRLVAYGADQSSLGIDIGAVAASRSLQLVPDPAPDRLVFIRSDQYSFIRKGTPSLMLAFAPAPNSAESMIEQNWLHERYHGQADDLQQPIDLQAADQFDGMLVALIRRIADQPKAPGWNPDSFFRRFATAPLK